MKITIIAVGKLKEKYWQAACREYTKRLGSYIKLNILEVADEKCPEKASKEEQKQIKKKEAQRIRQKLPKEALPIALEVKGKEQSSEGFSAWLEDLPHRGISHTAFLIGGSLGLDEDLSRECSEKISFGRFTYPHQLMRVILLEQIYRACRISRNEPYHK